MNTYEENLLSVFSIGMNYREKPTQHSHKFHEFFLCLEGEGFQHIGRNTIKMKKDELFFFPAGQMHIGNGPINGNCLGGVVYISKNIYQQHNFPDAAGAEIISVLTENALRDRNRIPVSPEGGKELRASFLSALREAAGRKKGYRLGLKTGISSFLLAILRHSRFDFPSIDSELLLYEDSRIKDICVILEENISEHYSIDRIAAMANLSRSRFHALFRKTTGKSFIEYLNIMRVNAALELLQETTLPISEIAMKTGFNSMGNFFNVFKRYSNMTPEKARNLKQ